MKALVASVGGHNSMDRMRIDSLTAPARLSSVGVADFDMQTCSYCGRENADGALKCRECGSDLAGTTVPDASRKRLPRLNLDHLANAFTTHDGFSRPAWTAIHATLRKYHAPDARLAAWADVVAQWASRWETELGGDYWVMSSSSMFLVSELSADAADQLLRRTNRLAEIIRRILDPIAWEDRPGLLMVQIADKFVATRFDDAMSTEDEQTYTVRRAQECALPWMLVSGGGEEAMLHEIKSGLTWNCLSHLPLPRWLQEGVAAHLWRAIEASREFSAPEVFDADLLPGHLKFWNETTIQSFWAGTCSREYPAAANLAHDLSKVLVYLLREKSPNLVGYLRCANCYDAGQSAAQSCLNLDLCELAGTFLGPGHWSPDSIAIAQCWDRDGRDSSEDD